jgi:hypothetical protein
MVSSGEIWQGVAADLRRKGVLLNNERLSIERLSTINMQALRARLDSNGGPPNDMESAFVDRFMQQQFWATHFTSATAHVGSEHGESVSLLSGPRLVELGVKYNTSNTTGSDITQKSDNDHVFFALECGNAPQKSTSRFGTGVYRVPFESLAASSPGVWGALDDLLKNGEIMNIELAFPALSEREAYDVGHHIGPAGRRIRDEAASYADVFTCEHLREAAALSLVNKFRCIQADIGGVRPHDNRDSDFSDSDLSDSDLSDSDLSDSDLSDSDAHAGHGQADPIGLHPMVQSCLASNTSDEFNNLLNTFHRVEIRVPRRLPTTDFVHFDANMLGWIKEPNATAAEPDQERLRALVKFCSGSSANAERKLGVLCEAGIDVRAIRSDQGGSLLHLLCANMATESEQHKQDGRSLIPALLAFGLDVNHVDASGASALEYARRDADLLRVLLEHGADLPSQVDQPGAEYSGSRERPAN